MAKNFKDRHPWGEIITRLTPRERIEVKNNALKDLKNSPRKGDQELYKELTSGDYDFMGFAPFAVYNKTNGNAEELQADWHHPFGRVTLVYGGKKKSCLIYVNATMRVNNSILNELKGNSKVDAIGITS